MQDLRALLRRPALLVWCLYILATPFYIAPNGMPQPGDALIFLLVPAALIGWNGRLNRVLGHSVKPLLWFIAWVFVVNYSWALILWKWSNFKDYLAYPIFYSFNGGPGTASVWMHMGFTGPRKVVYDDEGFMLAPR